MMLLMFLLKSLLIKISFAQKFYGITLTCKIIGYPLSGYLQNGQNSEAFINRGKESLAIVAKSETKLAIEQLLAEETFSRDESDRLMKIIQSRVVDTPSNKVGLYGEDVNLHNKNCGGDIAFQGTCLSFDRKAKSQETIPRGAVNLDALSPGYSSLQTHTPYLRATAVMEAKKWFKERKLGSSSKFDLDCGPCAFNTDMLQYDIASEVGSPVDVAKTYMRCLPPWQSSPLSDIGFKTPPSSGGHLVKDETCHATYNQSFPSLKGLKRNYVALGSYDANVENRNVRLKSTDDAFHIPKSRQGSFERFLEHVNSRISLAADKTGLYLEDHSDDHHKLSVSHPTKTSKIISSIVSEPHNPVPSINATLEIPILTNSSDPSQSILAGEPRQLDPSDVLISVENQEVEEPSGMKVQTAGVAAFLPVENGGPSSNAENPLLTANEMPSEETNPLLLSMQKNSESQGVSQANRPQMTKISSSGEIHSLSETRHNNGNTEPQNSIGSTQKISANNSSVELNTTSNLEPAINGSQAGIASNSSDGTRMKTIERMLAEPQPNVIRRGKKQVVSRSKRGRGRGS
ncbi:Galactose-binding-like domain-containing protein [Dioscorea alata]|uniref:Galactose-binding-like domain-containing protein n=1 Tax=Dioscorea alata TaxID=55571 RepID=A0ACB7VKR5_DIOAL|nr:Galactose-binding-like domain-containing protein [Dioscorea alata]